METPSCGPTTMAIIGSLGPEMSLVPQDWVWHTVPLWDSGSPSARMRRTPSFVHLMERLGLAAVFLSYKHEVSVCSIQERDGSLSVLDKLRLRIPRMVSHGLRLQVVRTYSPWVGMVSQPNVSYPMVPIRTM